MSHTMKVALAVTGLSFMVLTYANIQEPKNFDDCILKHVGKTENREAAMAVYQSCRNKFPQYISEADFNR